MLLRWGVFLVLANTFCLCSCFVVGTGNHFNSGHRKLRTSCLRHRASTGSVALRSDSRDGSDERLRGGAWNEEIEFYFWPSPNGHKVAIMLEEVGLPYTMRPINIGEGEQHQDEYLKLNPNNKVPTIVDPAGPDGSPFTVFESGAILLYLGEKAGQFLGGPPGSAGRHTVTQWLMFQMAGVGPMFGQNGYFRIYARGSDAELEHGRERYARETHRLYRVMDKRLATSDFLGGDNYSVADMATFPWIQPHMHGVDLEDFPNVLRWHSRIKRRPAVERAYAILADLTIAGNRSDAAHRSLFARRDADDSAPAAKQSGTGSGEQMQLWYTPIDNHVHAVEAVVVHCQLQHRIALVPTDPFGVDADKGRFGFDTLPDVNPLLTVPALKTVDGQPMYGGPVIYEYLNSQRASGVPSLFPQGSGADAIQVRRALWLADGLFDAFVLLLLESLVDPAQQRASTVQRTWSKIVRSLDALEATAAQWTAAAPALDIAQIRAACALDFMSSRSGPAECAGAGASFDWQVGRPRLTEWYEQTRKLSIFKHRLAALPDKMSSPTGAD